MDKPRSFRVKTGNLPAGIGHAAIVTATNFTNKLDRFYETFVFLVGYPPKLLHFKAYRTGYGSIPPEILPDASIWKYAEGFATAPVTQFLFEQREALGLSAMTGYHVELRDGDLHDISHLYFIKTVRGKVLEMMHTTHCEELETWLNSLAHIRIGYVDEEDITR